MQAEFPHGQCNQCGAAYSEFTCEQGKAHYLAMHAEGMCGNWSDHEPLEAEAITLGYCEFGCQPATTPVRRARPASDPWLQTLADYSASLADDLDSLPF
jgi:hypothetical protein